ncbi:hypothetical protein E2C01_004099 [Portunus trituberculatus]|uniref:Uncharacterized protein n=1 Tax=Portunus trituberculatus TaxID=210409 RepID=A0A5B7CVF0_PORTR|nr:hypothetical protein [Portunus trituberculatus]
MSRTSRSLPPELLSYRRLKTISG